MQREQGMLNRGGPAIAVVGLHVVILYGMAMSMGIVEAPKAIAPVEAVFIEEQPREQPEPEINVQPEIEEIALHEAPPQIEFEQPIAPPTETPIPASDSAIAAAAAPMNAPQQLATTHRVEPTYPPTSRRLGEEGTVLVKVLVDERGRARDMEIAQSSGFTRLDEAAMLAIKRWRFAAATDGSRAVTAWTQVAITFKLTQGQRR